MIYRDAANTPIMERVFYMHIDNRDTIFENITFIGESSKSKSKKEFGDGYFIQGNEIYKIIGGKKVGTCLYHKKTGQLYNLEVDEKYRQGGIGGKLVDLGMQNFDVRHIAVRKDNTIAYQMYRKRGFEEYDSFQNPYDNNAWTWYMELNYDKYARYLGLGKDYAEKIGKDPMEITSIDVYQLSQNK